MNIKLELCAADIKSVNIAQELNVDAVELCQDLIHGGITPSYGLIKQSRSIFTNELAILIRPRKGNFIYTPSEKKIMLDDLSMCIDIGADTIVIGALTESNEIDLSFLEQVILHSKGTTLCFHRAFDLIEDPISGLELLMEFQIERLLTSGHGITAIEGLPVIKELINHSLIEPTGTGQKINIMPGGGINANNIMQIIDVKGINRIHGSFSLHPSIHQQIMSIGSEELVDIHELQKVKQMLLEL